MKGVAVSLDVFRGELVSTISLANEETAHRPCYRSPGVATNHGTHHQLSHDFLRDSLPRSTGSTISEEPLSNCCFRLKTSAPTARAHRSPLVVVVLNVHHGDAGCQSGSCDSKDLLPRTTMVCFPDRLLGAGKVGDAIIVVLVEDHIVVDEQYQSWILETGYGTILIFRIYFFGELFLCRGLL